MAASEYVQSQDFKGGKMNPGEKFVAVTPHDTNELTYITRGILVAVAGTVKITSVAGDEVTVTLAAGIIHPIRAKIIWSTGTSATGIVGIS